MINKNRQGPRPHTDLNTYMNNTNNDYLSTHTNKDKTANVKSMIKVKYTHSI
jgi:hypothetical protein